MWQSSDKRIRCLWKFQILEEEPSLEVIFLQFYCINLNFKILLSVWSLFKNWMIFKWNDRKRGFCKLLYLQSFSNFILKESVTWQFSKLAILWDFKVCIYIQSTCSVFIKSNFIVHHKSSKRENSNNWHFDIHHKLPMISASAYNLHREHQKQI